MGAARALTSAAAWVLAALCLAGCAGLQDGAALRSRVDALLAPRVAANEFSGAVVLMRDGRTVYARGFGLANREAGLAFTADTPSDGGSLAKTFTAAGLAWLAHEGRVEPDAPVVRVLPGYPHAATTLHQLVAHSNGLPPYYEFFDPHFPADAARTTAAMLEVVARVEPAPRFAPGTRFEYSNLGYDAAALVIERVSGRSYEAFVRERFFAPLGLSSSFARPARLADWPGVRTRGYRYRDGRWQDFDAFDGEAFLGASNLMFSAADLARWGDAHAAGRVLPAAVAAAARPPPLIDGRSSPIDGLSWVCSDDGRRCHYTGSVQAFHAFVHWDRERRETVAFVSNGALPPWSTIDRYLAHLSAERDSLEQQVERRTSELTKLAQHLQRVREDERGHLARELHDELGGLLTAAKLDVARMRKRIDAAGVDVVERIRHLGQTLDAGIALKRRIIEDLRPSSLSNLGLQRTLEIQCSEFAQRSEIRVQAEIGDLKLDPERALAVYRVVQEALTNVAKYARATEVRVLLERVGEYAQLRVQDNGCGFDPRHVREDSHGLTGMRFRIRSCGGDLVLRSRPGLGTTIEATLPV